MRHHWQLIFSGGCELSSIITRRWGGRGAACGVGLPVHVDEVRSGGVHNKVQQSEHPGGDVGVHPVLVLLVLPVHEPDQDRDKCREVEEGSACSEPELHHQPVDSEFVEGLSKTEVVEAEEDGPKETNADPREEPVLAVHVGGGGAHDAEESEDQLEQFYPAGPGGAGGGVTASLTSLLW